MGTGNLEPEKGDECSYTPYRSNPSCAFLMVEAPYNLSHDVMQMEEMKQLYLDRMVIIDRCGKRINK